MIPEYVREQARLELARRSFWNYCKLKAPDFYKEDRLYLKDMCEKLQEFISSENKILVINMPPRHRQIKNSNTICTMVIRKKQ